MSHGVPTIEVLRDPSVTSAPGFKAGAVSAGVKEGTSRPDLAVVVSDAPCVAQAVFTRARVVAAPVLVSRQRVGAGLARGIVLNSGNANACTGEQGLADAREMADLAADRVGIDRSQMLVASTGVIGVPLPMERIRHGLSQLSVSKLGGHDAARAILTTDLVTKEYAVVTDLSGRNITVGGMAKGSGMIHPDMATMLSVVTTDAVLDPHVARSALAHATDVSFNQISVDRDTSTNDTLLLFASGASGGSAITGGTEATAFGAALDAVCIELARMVARDGEGATRLIEVVVEGAASDVEARLAARAVISSNLVKTAVYGRDPNWGRIVAAVGYSGADVDPGAIEVAVGGHRVAAHGTACAFDLPAVQAAMGAAEVRISVHLHRGDGVGRAWGCDLTEGYIKINAEYTT